MATRSMISVQNENGTYDSVYCHWDGYPSHVGAILRRSYNDYSKIQELIHGGSISSLDDDLEKTVTYHKWRNEPIVFEKGIMIDDLLNFLDGVDYIYIFDGATWSYYTHTKNNQGNYINFGL